MRAIVIGTGTIGSAVRKTLHEHGDEVVSVGRKSGDYQADISDMASLKKLFDIGSFDAVANAAGDVFSGPFEQLTDEQWAKSIIGKGMGQINVVVRAALPRIADRGSFTLVSGVLTDDFIHGGTIGTTINHLVEGFVKAAAAELPRGVRLNCISPTVLVESAEYHKFFPGFPPVPVAEVAFAYRCAISNPVTGRIIKLHKTNS